MTVIASSWQPASAWRPEDDALDLWRFRVAVAPDDEALLSEQELKRAARLLVEHKRRQQIAARAGLRRILACYVDRAPERLRFELGEHGKPDLVESGGPEFNLSHSEEMVVVAVWRHSPLGVDVEQRRSGRRFEALAERFFSTPEFWEWRRLGPAQREEGFYRVWCRKEAYLKAWGTGLTFSSRRFTVAVSPEARPWLLSTEMLGDDGRGWQIFDFDPADNYCAAVCWRGIASSVRCFSLD